VATIWSGFLGKIRGSIGGVKFVVDKRGHNFPVPRYPHDPKTPAQLECRRRLTRCAKHASKIYLAHLKQLSYYYGSDYTPVYEFCRRNLLSYAEGWTGLYGYEFSPYVNRHWWFEVDEDNIAKTLKFYWPAAGYTELEPTDRVKIYICWMPGYRVLPDPGNLLVSDGSWLVQGPFSGAPRVLWVYGYYTRPNLQGRFLPVAWNSFTLMLHPDF
jgi:hypothetical protein